MTPPSLLTFDIFGTVCDWRTGLTRDLAAYGITLDDPGFDRIIDCQARIEFERFRPYAEITELSLIETLALPLEGAANIGAYVGDWPLYADSAEALRRLMTIAPCAAMTNSDATHGEQMQAQIGFRLNHWFPAGDVGLYKPHPDFWRRVSERLNEPFGPRWWHVSAYADYDLDVAQSLGLTTVFIDRPHSRPGPADYFYSSLESFAETFE